jgi:DNA polymerase-3 subunit alpha
MDYTELHVHSMFSIKDGLSSCEELAERAKELGMDSLAITEHGSIDSWLPFRDACKEHNIKPIYGCEFYIVEDHTIKEKKEDRKHMSVYAKNEQGLINIRKMLSIAGQEGLHRAPRISPAVFKKHHEGLVVATACLGSFVNTIWGEKFFRQLAKKMKDDLYVEIHGNDWTGQDEWNMKLYDFAQELDLKAIVANDIHYTYEWQAEHQEMLLCLSSMQWNRSNVWSNPDRWKFESKSHWLKDGNEMLQAFKKMGTKLPKQYVVDAINNTREIVEKCNNVLIEDKPVHLPLIAQCEPGNENEFFKDIIKKGFKEVVLESEWFSELDKEQQKITKKEYLDRIKLEYDLMERKGFVRYFLIVHDLIAWCKSKGIQVGTGRGSVGGSLVSYCIGITRLTDPIKYGLLFERFLSESRKDLADIDLDFDSSRRGEVIDYLKETYGSDNVAYISTFSYLKFKSSFKGVCRAFEIDAKYANSLTKEIPDLVDVTIDNVDEFEEINYFLNKNPKIKEFTFALNGVISNLGAHAAGIVISEHPLSNGENCVLSYRGKDKDLTINLDKRYCETQGLMKLDILGLAECGIIRKCFDYIKANHSVDLDFEDIPLGDERVYQMLSQGNTTAVFQMSGYTASNVCRELKIDSFDDMMIVNSIARPGPDTEEVIKRKRRGSWKKWGNDVDHILDDTFGCMLYQEQIMRIFNEIAGFDKEKTEKMRKLVSKSMGVTEMNKYKKDFVDGCIDLGIVSDDQADRLWSEIIDFSKYAFNKSHCCSYSYIGYIGAWLKVNYPAEFFAAVLTFSGDEKASACFEDAISNLRLEVELPKMYISDSTDWKAKDNKLYCPFKSMKGIGPAAAKEIAEYVPPVNQGFFDLGIDSSGLKPKIVSMLDSIGAFDEGRKLTLAELRKVNELFPFDLMLLA